MPRAKKPRAEKAKKKDKVGVPGSILSYAPAGVVLRDGQVKTLLEIEANWTKAEVFLIDAPVSAGKSIIAVTIARWLYGALDIKSTIAVPNNILLKQYTDEFSFLTTLRAQRTYACTDLLNARQSRKLSCGDFKKFNGSFCDARTCCYLKDVRKANAMPTGVYNYHTLLAYRMFREAQIFDEAHNVRALLTEAAGKKLWRHVYRYPDYIRTYGHLHHWVSTHPDRDTDKKLQLLLEELETGKNDYLVERTEDLYHGELRDVIKLNPVDVSGYPPILWPEKKTQKLIFMSATMNLRDIQDLGLDKRKVMTISTPSPIPVERRPCIVDTRFNMSYHAQDRSLPQVAEALLHFLSENPERGFIHATYALASKLRAAIDAVPGFEEQKVRILFHSAANKSDTFEYYKETPGAVLVASGMYEGISLNEDLARWQILLKVPWPSLAEPAIKWKAENDEEFYLNATAKDVAQMYGRVCRGPLDYGVSYIWDKSFLRLYDKGHEHFPAWFKEAVNVK